MSGPVYHLNRDIRGFEIEFFGQVRNQTPEIDVGRIFSEIASELTAAAGVENESVYAFPAPATIAESARSKVVRNVRFMEPRQAVVQSVPCELSVVMPCLNEADTLAVCILKAQSVLREQQIDGEIIVADNGSTDGSIEIAQELGARVVHVAEKGYGNALMGGIAAARGQSINQPLMKLSDTIIAAKCKNVGLKLGSDNEEYPLWVMLKNRGFNGTIHHFYVENESASIPSDFASPDVIVSIVTNAPEAVTKEFPYVERYGEYTVLWRKRPTATLVPNENRVASTPL